MMVSKQTQLRVPGPPARLAGYANLVECFQDPIKVMGRLFGRYGPIASLTHGTAVRLFSSLPHLEGVVFVHGPELLRQISNGHGTFHRRQLAGPLLPQREYTQRENTLRYFGTSFFDINNDEHRRARRLVLPAFHRKRVEAYRDQMVALTEAMLERWRIGEVRNMHHEMTHITMQVVMQLLFGVDLHTVGSRLGRAISETMDLTFHPAVVLLHIDRPGFPYKTLLDRLHTVERDIRQILAEKRAKGGDDGDVLSMLLQARDEEDGSPLSEDELVSHAEFLYMAGHETSSNALTWTLLLLSQHPQILADLVDELDGVLRGAAPTVEQLRQLPLLDRVVKESLRILPPVPWNARIAAEPTLLGGHYIPPGTEVIMSIYHTHHMPELYPEPERFLPSRWENRDYSVFEYVPFSGGPRTCLGITFAQMEIKIVLSILIQRFRLQMASQVKVNRFIAATMGLRPSLPMIIHPQDRQFQRGVGGMRGNIREMVELP